MTELGPISPPDGTRMTVGEHIDELRGRIVRCLVATGVVAIAAFAAHRWILEVILAPAWNALDALPGAQLVQTEVGEGFITAIRVSIIVALFVVSPYLTWQIWAFIGAGLYRHERRYVKLFAVPTFVLFLAGVAFNYFFVLPWGLEFLIGFLREDAAEVGGRQVVQYIKISDYVGFCLTLCLIMGFVFQLPLLMVALDRIGLVTVATFRRYRRHFLLAAFIVGAILTPPDPFTQIAVASALIVLFELGIWFALFIGRGARAPADTKRKDP